MKVLFSIISIIAAGYLAIQTQYVQNVGSNIGEQFKGMLLSNSNEIGQALEQDFLSKDAVAANERNNVMHFDGNNSGALANVNNQTNDSALQAQIERLTEKNDYLSNKVISIENKLEHITKNEQVHSGESLLALQDTARPLQPTAAPVANASFKVEQAKSQIALLQQPITEEQQVVTASDASEQEKRVKQQAILRELSQRMELSALRSLTQ